MITFFLFLRLLTIKFIIMENTNIIFKNQQEKEQISIITDPFQKSCIKTIAMFAHIESYGNKARITGSVNFKNGDTEGTQNFKASSMAELFMKIYNFCESLK